jgi:hypothetical protein
VGNEVNWPEHLSLTLSHNEHKNYYQTVAESIAAGDHGYDCWVSDEQMQKAITTDECWTLQWYPITPIGFNILSAADLDVLMAAVVSK